jgi:AAA ATPase domain
LAISVSHGLLERERELGRLRTLLSSALEGRGGVALVDGPAGIGKTRLLQATREAATECGLRVLTARGVDLERDFPYGVVRQLFEAGVTGSASAPWAFRLEGAAAFAQPVFGSTRFAGEQGQPPDLSAAIRHGLYQLVCDLSEARSLLLAVDDAHWSDAPSLLFLHSSPNGHTHCLSPWCSSLGEASRGLRPTSFGELQPMRPLACSSSGH